LRAFARLSFADSACAAERTLRSRSSGDSSPSGQPRVLVARKWQPGRRRTGPLGTSGETTVCWPRSVRGAYAAQGSRRAPGLAMLIPLAVAIAALASGRMTVGLLSHAVSIPSVGPTLGILIGLGCPVRRHPAARAARLPRAAGPVPQGTPTTSRRRTRAGRHGRLVDQAGRVRAATPCPLAVAAAAVMGVVADRQPAPVAQLPDQPPRGPPRGPDGKLAMTAGSLSACGSAPLARIPADQRETIREINQEAPPPPAPPPAEPRSLPPHAD
jgi:hypothetical protein